MTETMYSLVNYDGTNTGLCMELDDVLAAGIAASFSANVSFLPFICHVCPRRYS